MLILGIDTSAKTASCGIYKDGRMIVDYTLNHKRTHSEKLLEMIDMSLKIAQLDITEVDAFAVCKGPGSFTGLRIGLATVKGLCHALNKPCYLCSTLLSLYENVHTLYNQDIIFAPVMDARRSEVYGAAFLNDEQIIEDCALPITELIDRINVIDSYRKIVFTGDGVEPNKDIIKAKLSSRALFAPEHLIYGSGSSVINAALKENFKVDYNNILPTYLRVSQAERLKTKGSVK